MSHAAAAKIIEAVLKHCAEQDKILEEIRSRCTEEDFVEYRRMIGRSMGAMLVDVINPIVEKYPDLKPRS